jgi:hypothetical protein
MAYDGMGRVVLYGGDADPGTPDTDVDLNDTWRWDSGSTSWTLRVPDNTTPPRVRQHALAYAGVPGYVLMFGGSGRQSVGSSRAPLTTHENLWLWSGSNWTNECPSSPPCDTAPDERINHAWAYDPVANHVALLHGETSTLSNDAYYWSAVGWNQLGSTIPGTRRYYHRLTTDGCGLLTFGGNQTVGSVCTSPVIDGDTWILR